MKKIQLFALGLLGASMFLTSCEDDTNDDGLAPTLNMVELTSGEVSGDITISLGQSLVFTWDSRKGDVDLESFDVDVTGVNAPTNIPTSNQGNSFPYDIANADDENYVDTLVFNNAALNTGVTNYSFNVTDRDGLSKEVSFTVTVESGTTALSAAQSFTWTRVGGAAGTGLAQFGLAWTSNSATSAIVTTGANTTMVALSASAWSSITTQEDLADAIANGTAVTEYRGVSATANGTYDDVIAVDNNGALFLLQVQNGAVSTGGAGTTITIDGEYKN
jgi:hypothetical protein